MYSAQSSMYVLRYTMYNIRHELKAIYSHANAVEH